MSDATQATTAPASTDAAQLDNLAHLHRMSRTAGLGSSEYSAVNVAAVAAVVMGALSALSLMTPIFLIVPVAGLIIAIIAIKQIKSSGGTQTGLALAIIGLLACFGFAGVRGFQQIQSDRQQMADRQQIDQLVIDFGSRVASKKYDDALKLADPRWQDQVSAKRLEGFFDGFNASAFGQLKDFKPTGLYDIQEDPETHMRQAVGMMGVEAEHTSVDRPVRTEIRFRNDGDSWKIFAMPEWFPPPAAPGAAAPGKGQAPSGPAGPPSP